MKFFVLEDIQWPNGVSIAEAPTATNGFGGGVDGGKGVTMMISSIYSAG